MHLDTLVSGMLRNVIELLPRLRPKHIRVLKILLRSLPRYQYVPINVLAAKLKMKSSMARKILQHLIDLGLVVAKEKDYEGYRLSQWGLDLLALRKLRNFVELQSISHRIDVGKEADIYVCYGADGSPYIIKAYRLGRTSFKKVRSARPVYHVEAGSWFAMSIKAAKREFHVLSTLWGVGVAVPKPLIWAYHMILMDYVPGRELHKVRLRNPLSIFRNTIEEIIKAYYVGGIVHGDLSEYNILVNEETGEIWIIDWPQWLPADHPEASEYLRKDLEQIIKYFHRKYKLDFDVLWEIVETVSRKYLDQSREAS